MYKWNVWVQIGNGQTANTIVYAADQNSAKKLAEAQFGVGNVLNYTRIDE
jgi:hypothetical protein